MASKYKFWVDVAVHNSITKHCLRVHEDDIPHKIGKMYPKVKTIVVAIKHGYKE